MIRMVVLVPWIHLDVVNVNIFHISGFQGTPAGLRISARHDVTCMPTSTEFRVGTKMLAYVWARMLGILGIYSAYRKKVKLSLKEMFEIKYFCSTTLRWELPGAGIEDLCCLTQLN